MQILHLTLRQLQIFCAVAEQGSTTAAAQSVSLSQSATSAAINELEKSLGLPLFDRVGKRLALNNNGRSLLPQARGLLHGAAAVEHWAKNGESQLGEMRIGASTTIGSYLLPDLLADFRKTFSTNAGEGWQVQVRIANSAEIISEVAVLDLDFGLIEGPCNNPDLIVTPWLEDELVVVAAPGHPILPKRRGRRIALSELRETTWLLREPGSGTREIVNQLLIPHLHHLKSGIEFGNSEAIKRAAAGGLGLTCLSRYVVADLLESGALIAPATELPRLSRRLSLVMHRSKQRTRGLERLLGHLGCLAESD